MNNSENNKGPRFKRTATLKESLMETPKTSLVSISKIFGWHIKPSLRKEEFASQLAEMILGNPSHVLEFQTVYELRFLKKVVEAPDDEPYKAIKEDYDKVIEGNLIALGVGFKQILDKCPRFKAWIMKLIKACSDGERDL